MEGSGRRGASGAPCEAPASAASCSARWATEAVTESRRRLAHAPALMQADVWRTCNTGKCMVLSQLNTVAQAMRQRRCGYCAQCKLLRIVLGNMTTAVNWSPMTTEERTGSSASQTNVVKTQ